MSVDLNAIYTITAPSATDGFGEVAVLNDSTSGNFVGYLFDSSGFESPDVRESFDDIVEGDGGVHGSFYHGRRPFTLDVWLAIAATEAATHARLDKFLRATNAMRADGTIAWTETGGAAKLLNFRRQQPVRGPSQERRCLFAGVSADPRIYASTATTGGAGTCANAGTVGTSPTFTLTSPTNTITLTNSTTSQTLTLLGLSGAGTVTVNFLTKTVTATIGTANRYSAVSFPSSVWWELQPGNNTVAVSGATVSGSGISWRSAWL